MGRPLHVLGFLCIYILHGISKQTDEPDLSRKTLFENTHHKTYYSSFNHVHRKMYNDEDRSYMKYICMFCLIELGKYIAGLSLGKVKRFLF